MDVNAVYFGDSDFSGPSASLKGPRNMNGGGTQFEGKTVQWDQAVALGQPGLKGQGSNKATFVEAGETLRVKLPISSLDEIEFFGTRATLTSTPEGSIKAVSGNPEEPDVPEEPEEPHHPEDPEEPGDAAFYDKVFFAISTDPANGFFLTADGKPVNDLVLPEGALGTFEDYVNAFFESVAAPAAGQITEVVFYLEDERGNLIAQESPWLEIPEGGFQTPKDFIAAYNEAINPSIESGGEDLNHLWLSPLMSASIYGAETETEKEQPEDEDTSVL